MWYFLKCWTNAVGSIMATSYDEAHDRTCDEAIDLTNAIDFGFDSIYSDDESDEGGYQGTHFTGSRAKR